MIQRESFPLLYRDAHLAAFHKPAGLLMHPSRIERRARHFAVNWAREHLGAPVFPVHRLDRATSGVLLFALNIEAARRLAVAFQSRQVVKTYLAVVRGWIPAAGRIDHPLKEALCKIADADVDPDKAAQAALTDFQRLGRVEIPEPVDKYLTSRYSLVAVWPRTGRRHQIRRHLRRLGHPIVGDTSYGQGVHNRFFRLRYDCPRMLLAAAAIALDHPVSGRHLVIRAPLEAEFQRIVDALGWTGLTDAWYRDPWGMRRPDMQIGPRIEVLKIPPFDVNTYLIICPETAHAAVIDPAGQPEQILALAEQNGARITMILNTHGHADHVQANAAIKQATGAPVGMHAEDDRFFSDPQRRALIQRELGLPAAPPADRRLADGEVLELGSLRIRVIHTPGHTPGSVCFLVAGQLFTGDTLFVGDVGRTDLSGGSLDRLLKSLAARIITLPPDTVVWPGHDYGETPTSTLGRERRENPYITDFLLDE